MEDPISLSQINGVFSAKVTIPAKTRELRYQYTKTKLYSDEKPLEVI
jgi:hypothetical protein